jgi:hypothetical protein
MLEHLIGPGGEPKVCENPPTDFVGVDAARPAQVLEAQLGTTEFLEALGLTASQVTPAAAANAARETFAVLAAGHADEEAQVHRLLELKVPESIRHTMAMLTAYDWEFVNEAKRLRGFVVGRLVEEAEKAGKAGDRIKALTALGKVTEVGLFTDKIEVKHVKVTDERTG